jgi:hypothetical protein
VSIFRVAEALVPICHTAQCRSREHQNMRFHGFENPDSVSLQTRSESQYYTYIGLCATVSLYLQGKLPYSGRIRDWPLVSCQYWRVGRGLVFKYYVAIPSTENCTVIDRLQLCKKKTRCLYSLTSLLICIGPI